MGHGRWSTGIALEVAEQFGRTPGELAVELARTLQAVPGVARVDVAGPGFLDITLSPAAVGELARTIVRAGTHYGGDSWGAEAASDDPLGATEVERRRVRASDEAVRTFGDLVASVGADAARYALLRTPAHAGGAVDLQHVTRRSCDNPVFAVQFAHARTCVAAERAAAGGVRLEDGFVPELLTHETESALLAILADYPRVLAQAAEGRQPHRMARYLEELAAAYHRWHDLTELRPSALEPVGDRHRTRLWLNAAAGRVLASGLGLLGVSAPRRL